MFNSFYENATIFWPEKVISGSPNLKSCQFLKLFFQCAWISFSYSGHTASLLSLRLFLDIGMPNSKVSLKRIEYSAYFTSHVFLEALNWNWHCQGWIMNDFHSITIVSIFFAYSDTLCTKYLNFNHSFNKNATMEFFFVLASRQTRFGCWRLDDSSQIASLFLVGFNQAQEKLSFRITPRISTHIWASKCGTTCHSSTDHHSLLRKTRKSGIYGIYLLQHCILCSKQIGIRVAGKKLVNLNYSWLWKTFHFILDLT